MTSPATPDKMVIAYRNEIDPLNCTGITPSNITEVPGYSINNLLYQSPARLFKFDMTSGPGTVSMSFALTNVDPYIGIYNCFGIIRHNLYSATRYQVDGSNITLKEDTTTICTQDLDSDGDVLVLFPSPEVISTPSKFNFFITTTVAPDTMYIGSVFLGFYSELQTNPTDGQLSIAREASIEVQESSGGGRHFLNLGDRDRYALNFETRRAKEEDVRLFSKELTQPRARNRLVGVIPPWETQAPGTNDMGHFFGYVTNVEVKPRMSASTDHRFDLSVEMIGA